MKKKLAIAAVVVAILAAFAGILLVFFNSGLYPKFLKYRIGRQMEKMYGVSFEIGDMDESLLGLPNFNKDLRFNMRSEEDILAVGECDWKGKLLAESYAHYYYAAEMNTELGSVLENIFDDCYIVRDCIEFGGNVAQDDLIELNYVSDAEEYMNWVLREQTYFRVYLKSTVTKEKLEEALKRLDTRAYEGNVYFIPVEAELFEELKGSGIACYYPHSSISLRMSEHIHYIDQVEIDNLIYDPFAYTKASYVPKHNISKITE